MRYEFDEHDKRFPPDDDFVNSEHLGKLLNIGTESARAAILSGLAGPYYTVNGKNPMVSKRNALGLSKREYAKHDTRISPALRLTTTVNHWCNLEKRYVGWHADLPEHELLESLRKWHKINTPEELIGRAFVVSMSGFVVMVKSIQGMEFRPDRKFALELDHPTETQLTDYSDKRVPLLGGKLSRIRPIPK